MYTCLCKPGYSGDGYICASDIPAFNTGAYYIYIPVYSDISVLQIYQPLIQVNIIYKPGYSDTSSAIF